MADIGYLFQMNAKKLLKKRSKHMFKNPNAVDCADYITFNHMGQVNKTVIKMFKKWITNWAGNGPVWLNKEGGTM